MKNNIDHILLKAYGNGDLDIKSFRYYSRLINITETGFIYQDAKEIIINEKTIGKVYVDHIRRGWKNAGM